MKEWVILAVAVSVLSSAFSLLLAESEIKKAFRVLCGAVMVLVILFPFVDLSENLSEYDFEEFASDFSVSFNDENDEVIFSAVKHGYLNILNDTVMKNFSEINSVDIEITDDDGIYKLKTVDIYLNGETDNYTLIEDEVHSITESECEVVFINES